MRPKTIGVIAVLLSVLFAETGFAQEERQFANGTVWVPLPTKIETYMIVERGLGRCSSGRWLMISFANRDTLSDEDAAQGAVLDAVEGLSKICKEAKGILVNGYIASEAQPDANGEISPDQMILSADVSRWSGPTKIVGIRNKVLAEKEEAERAKAAAAAQAELDAKLAKQQAEDEEKRQEDDARFKAQQVEFANHIASVRALAQPHSGLLGFFGGGAEQKLVGVWSNPDGLCDRDLLVFYVQDTKRVSEFWSRAGELDLAPVFEGEWTVDNDIVQLRYTKELKMDGINKAVEVKEESVIGRVRLISADQDSLTITAKGVSDPLPLFLFYPEKTKLLRCK